MASGKLSPRQKMINMMYLVLTALLALNVSKEVLNSFFEVNTGVVRTTSNFANKNIETYNDFTAAAELNPVKAGPFRDQALAVKSEADAIVRYIQELKYKLVLSVDKSVFLGQYKDLEGEIIQGNETQLEWGKLSKEQKSNGVVTHSSGNHAHGIALAAKKLGMSATIVMPSDAPRLKLEGTLRLGAKVIEYDRATESRERIAEDIAKETGATLVPAFEDFEVMAGQGTVGLEIVDQLNAIQQRLDTFLSPCGGGGLLAGTSTAITNLLPTVRVFGVEQEQYDDHALSKAAGHRVQISGEVPTMCDSLMASTPGEMTWSVNSKTVDDFLVVSEDSIAYAVAFDFRH